jgi:hypothetical protein
MGPGLATQLLSQLKKAILSKVDTSPSPKDLGKQNISTNMPKEHLSGEKQD